MKYHIFKRAILTLVISYFMFVGVLYQQNVKSSEARHEFPPVSGTGSCVQGVNKINLSARCRSNKLITGYREMKFDCYGKSGGELHSRSCVSMENFKQLANSACLQLSSCQITPSVTPPEPKTCLEKPACLDADPPCQLMPPVDSLPWCEATESPTPTVSENLTRTPTPTYSVTMTKTPTPTICAMPTIPLCQDGSMAVESDIPNVSGICGFKYICNTTSPTP